ncbi:MAG: hypothetical protein V4677_15760 [Bacteroidota bacterium]
MEEPKDEIEKKENPPITASTHSDTYVGLASVLGAVSDETLLHRMVPGRYIRKDNSISLEAYRPRKRAGTPTGFEKNVSTIPKNCFGKVKIFDRHRLIEMQAYFPNNKGYPSIQDKECHIGITGDMEELFTDEESLEEFAFNSTPI